MIAGHLKEETSFEKSQYKITRGSFIGLNMYLYTKYNPNNYYSPWMWDNTIYSRDALQSICAQQEYTNERKRRVDTGS